jgi:hypothetical protein
MTALPAAAACLPIETLKVSDFDRGFVAYVVTE